LWEAKAVTRAPIVSGQFYESSPAACRRAVEGLLAGAELPGVLPAHCVGGLVPHAGWVCSGRIAAMTLKALAADWNGQTVVLLGAVHAYSGPKAMLYPAGSWETPLGQVPVDAELAQSVLNACGDVAADPAAHGREHSLEVQLPLIQMVMPAAKILPLMVPPSPLAVMIGEQLGSLLSQQGIPPLVVGSTDLTHYGPRYGLTTAGTGPGGVDWAMANDRHLLTLVESMAADRIVDQAVANRSACGAGAIAAAIAACGALGATAGTVLAHTNSCETLKAYGQRDNTDSVGYASVVFA